MGLGRRNQAKQCPRPLAPAKRTSWSGRFARARLRVALDSFEGFIWPWSGREFCETPLVDMCLPHGWKPLSISSLVKPEKRKSNEQHLGKFAKLVPSGYWSSAPLGSVPILLLCNRMMHRQPIPPMDPGSQRPWHWHWKRTPPRPPIPILLRGTGTDSSAPATPVACLHRPHLRASVQPRKHRGRRWARRSIHGRSLACWATGWVVTGPKQTNLTSLTNASSIVNNLNYQVCCIGCFNML